METGNHIHKFQDIVIPATCKEIGYTLHKCQCGYEHKDSFTPIGGHKFLIIEDIPATCGEEGKRSYRCEVCGVEKTEAASALGHAWEEWNIQKHPTCTEKGTQVHICTRCGQLEEKELEAKGHKLTLPKKNEVQKGYVDYFCENCGQTITLPTFLQRMKTKFQAHKKAILISVISLFCIIIAAGLFFASTEIFIPYYHYSRGISLIEEEKYTEAYVHLKKSKNYKDSKEILGNFVYIYDEIINTDEDGNIVWKREYDENGNITNYIYYLFNGTYVEDKREYEYDQNGNITLHVEYDDSGNVEYKYEYKYDQNGNITLHVRYDASGNVEYKYEYEYDQNGNEILRVSYDQSGNVEYKYEYKYDQNGNMILKIWYDKKGNINLKTEYQYDHKGNCTLYITYDSQGDIISKDHFEYDQNGTLTAKIQYNSEGNVREKCEYDQYGNLTLDIKYDSEGNVIEKCEYDQYGNLTLDIKYDSEGNVNEKHEYEYDKNCNMIIYVEYDKDGNVHKRECIYDKNFNLTHMIYYFNGEVAGRNEYVNPRFVYKPQDK